MYAESAQNNQQIKHTKAGNSRSLSNFFCRMPFVEKGIYSMHLWYKVAENPRKDPRNITLAPVDHRKPNLMLLACLPLGTLTITLLYLRLLDATKQAWRTLRQELISSLCNWLAHQPDARKKFTEIVQGARITQRPGPAESHWLGPLEKDDIPIPGPTFSHCTSIKVCEAQRFMHSRMHIRFQISVFALPVSHATLCQQKCELSEC
jgi:hypothetical protein